MVKTLSAVTALLLTASPAFAEADWRAAGGALFVAPAQPASTGYDVRLPPLNQPFGAAVRAAAERHGLDPKLLHALIIVESAYRPDAVSVAGAVGLTQLMPATAQALGVTDRFEPIANVDGGAAYLASQLVRFGNLRLALAAYNAGPTRVAKLGQVPDSGETRRYVDAVISCFLTLSAGRGVVSASACAEAPSP